MSISRDELLALIAQEAQNHPVALAHYQAGNPLLLMNLNAIATMLAMISQQLDMAAGEAFAKTRDTTVLADASMKGILPFARPGRVQIGVNNRGSSVVNLAAGRRLLDPSGKVYLTESALNLAAGASGSLSARQMVKRDMVQVVNASQPFYAIQITPPSDPENAISGLAVSVNGIDYPYAQVATVHDLDAVKASMQAAVLVLYGRDAQAVRAGMFSLIHKTFASHLRQEVSALQVEVSDFQVMVTPPACLLPEPALFDCRPSQHKTKQKPQANQMQETEIRNHCGP